MYLASLRVVFLLAASGLVAARAQAPVLAQPVQPGLEAAVKWKWWVLPSEEKDWGLTIAEPSPEPEAAPKKIEPAGPKKVTAVRPEISIPPGNYEVKRGDALVIIARKAGISLGQLKKFNALTNDLIRVGQTLKIPTAEELAALAPPPATPAPAVQATSAEPKRKGKKSIPKTTPEPEVDPVPEATLLQAFLDRENFTIGPIDGKRSAGFEQLLMFYRGLHRELETAEALHAKAVAVVGQPFTHYKLKHSDFRFIAAPKAVSLPLPEPPKGKKSKTAALPKAPAPRPITYDELAAAKYLAYWNPWEFVAERFHCDEAFLRSLNSNIKGTPGVDAEFQVPNVIPFEIEKCFAAPLRPAADADHPVTAAIVEFSRLEIRRGEQLVAVMPISRARPDLRGRGSWTILDAIPGPRLATRQELKTPPKVIDPNAATTLAAPNTATPSPPPAPTAPALASDQILAAGPRNPVGVYWVNLAKANSVTPLPYGLHGTSIPGRMKSQQSLGGLRLSNWDIARAVRMLPEGAPLAWR